MNVLVHLDGDIHVSVRSEIYTRSTGQANKNEAHLPVSHTFPVEQRENYQFRSLQINNITAIN